MFLALNLDVDVFVVVFVKCCNRAGISYPEELSGHGRQLVHKRRTTC